METLRYSYCYSRHLYVEQRKACARRVPEVITADIIDGKVEISSEHHLEDKDFSLSEITHYAWLDSPYDE